MNRFAMTALASAVVHNHVPCVEVLVKAGADVNAKDDRNFSPIMIAAKNGYFDSLLGMFSNKKIFCGEFTLKNISQANLIEISLFFCFKLSFLLFNFFCLFLFKFLLF